MTYCYYHRATTVTEVECRSILNRSGIPGVDYALNPYVGCEHGCRYCYADFMKRFTGHTEPWGSFVDVKINAPEVLERQLRRLRPGVISLSTVTDPYQPLEARYGITRNCLAQLVNCDFPVSILTKSALVLRDIDLLRSLKNLDVGLTVTSLDEQIRRAFEPHSSPSGERLDVLGKLSREGIKTWIFFGPVLPHFSDSEDAIDALFAEAARAEVDHVLVDTLNLYPKVWSEVKALLKEGFPRALAVYENYRQHQEIYCGELQAKIEDAATRHGVAYRLAF